MLIFVSSNGENPSTAGSSSIDDSGAAHSQQHEQQHWSDEEIESLLLTVVLFGVLTSLIYNFIIKPILQPANLHNNNNGPQQQQQQQQAGRNDDFHQRQRYNPQRVQQQQQQQRRMDNFGGVGNTNNADDNDPQPDGDLFSLLTKLSRVPPHIATTEQTSSSSSITSAILQDGVVPFRYTHASSFEKKAPSLTTKTTTTTASTATDLVLQNRRERAKIFAKLFRPPSSTTATSTKPDNTSASSISPFAPSPPLRGANIVVTIKVSDVKSPKIHKILYLLGTYYNLFVVLSLDPSLDSPSSSSGAMMKKNNDDLNGEEKHELELVEGYKNQLLKALDNDNDDEANSNDTKVSRKVIPPHRIIASTSALGRIAFVRQLGKKGAEIILDYDKEVYKQLDRFGFTVLLYPEQNKKKMDDDDGNDGNDGGDNMEKKCSGKEGEEKDGGGVGVSGLGDMLLP